MKSDKDKIQEVEAALTEKGITKEDYAEIQHLLKEHKEANERIEEERGEQYFEDAFKATSGMGLTRSMVTQVAHYLSNFAERIASEAIAKERESAAIEEATDNGKKDIVDHIPNAVNEEA